MWLFNCTSSSLTFDAVAPLCVMMMNLLVERGIVVFCREGVARLCVFVFVFAEKSWEQDCTLRCVEVGAGCRLECCVGSLPAKDEVQGHRSSGVQPNLLLSVPFTLHFAIYPFFCFYFGFLHLPILLILLHFIFTLTFGLHKFDYRLLLIMMPSAVLASLLVFQDKKSSYYPLNIRNLKGAD